MIHALEKRHPSRFIIFSSLPSWFWKENLSGTNFQSIHAETDIGLVQKSPFSHDIDLSAQAWKDFLSFSNENFYNCLRLTNELQPDSILCDISPLGLKIGKSLQIPTVLIENFTWDWMFEIYARENAHFKGINQKLSDLYESFDVRLQAIPYCKKAANGITINPIHRCQVQPAPEVRKQLNIPSDHRMILITTGGIVKNYDFIQSLRNYSDHTFLLPGNFDRMESNHNIIRIPMRGHFHFPDLVCASDLVVGKVGYGTLVECWSAGTPLLGVYREDFRESQRLKRFSKLEMTAAEISVEEFESGAWLKQANKLSMEKIICNKPVMENGSLQVAREVNSLLDKR